ncbi:MAG: TlpA family protein disulfide reductase [Syntrophaceae bacterium]|nr:TlpA family protein disulfide reductase [Syntrophaceae bacterium]
MKENVIIKSTLFIMLFIHASVSWGQYLPHAPFKPQVVPAPDFTLKDVQGKIFRMSAQRGKPVLIFFGTTWCPGCRTEVPKYKKVHETYASRGLEVIYINIMEPEKKVTRFVQANVLPYRTLLDENGRVGAAYNVVGVPMIILVDKNGNIVKVGHSSSEMPLNQLLHSK